MWGSFSRARKVQTTVCCKHCGMPLFIERSCHEVHMFCPQVWEGVSAFRVYRPCRRGDGRIPQFRLLRQDVSPHGLRAEPKKHGSLRSIPLVIWRFLGYKVEIL